MRFDVPVTPDGDEGRELIQDELADPVYHEGRNLLDVILEWIRDAWHSVNQSVEENDVIFVPLVIVLLIIITVVVIIALTRSGFSNTRSALKQSSVVFSEQPLSAEEYRQRSITAASDLKWERALQERFRAIVRSMEERMMFDERPGRTAQEAVAGATSVLPEFADALHLAAQAFDATLYGKQAADAASYEALVALDSSIENARPQATTLSVETIGAAP